MPATSARQQRFMGMCAHNPKKGCPPMKVAKEFSHKPKGGYKRKKRVVPRKDSGGFY